MTLSSEALLTLRRTGRPRKSSRRMAGDRSPRETVADIVSIAKAYRVKNGAREEIALHEKYGTTIGQLHLESQIDGRQYNASQSYLRCVISNARLYGIPCPHPRSASLLMAGEGISCGADTPDEIANEIKGRFRDCRRALLDCGRDLLVGSAINRVVYGIVVENWPMVSIGPSHVQNLRCGLNALARVLG